MNKRLVNKSPLSSIKALILIWQYLSKNKKKQLKILSSLTILSGFSEVASITSVIPLLTLISNPNKLYSTRFFQFISDKLNLVDNSNLLLPITFIFGFTCILSALIRVFNLWLSGKIAAGIGSDLSYETYKRTLHQPYEIHINRNSSEVISSSIKQLDITVEAINLAIQLISGLTIVTFLLITLFIVNWAVALILIIIFGGSYIFLGLLTKKRLNNNSKKIINAINLQIKSLQEGLGSIRDVLIEGNQKVFLDIYLKADRPMRNLIAQNKFIGMFPRYTLEALGLLIIGFLAYFLSQILSQEKLIPVLGVMALASQRILPSMQTVYGSWAGLGGFSASIFAVIELLEQPLNKDLLPDKNYYKKFTFNSLVIKSIDFNYNSNSISVLKNISLNLNKGEILGIIGSTGSGKSTLLDIIMGLLIPTNGEIIINGRNIHKKGNINYLYSWRKNISHVPQNIYLADSTIAENIAFGIPKEKIDMQRVEKSAKIAQILDFLEKTPRGFETFVGERGVKLSGGQRQRIGIARALYKNSKILILDEATSALDIKTEKKLIDSLHKLRDDLTIIMIAHRLSTIQNCNRVIRVEKGKIIEDDSPENVLSKY